jgi:lactate permease
MTPWVQNYDPLGNPVISTAVAALPVVVLLGLIAFGRMSIHRAAVIGLLVALGVAILAFGMPVRPALASAGYGAATGLFPIGWIILNLLFLYELTLRRGLFEVLRNSLSRVAPDPRVQVILIAFCFGAFFEGAAGFGTPVAVTSAILVRLGFRPLQACGLSLIANTAPVAFGALGTPIQALADVTGLDAMQLSIMVGRQLPFFSLLVPFWCVGAMAGFRGLWGVWPVALVAGVAFAVPQFLVSNYHGPALVDIIASLTSIAAVLGCLRWWRPRDGWKSDQVTEPDAEEPASPARRRLAWMPWLVLSVLVFLWGLLPIKQFLDRLMSPRISVPELHEVVVRSPPVALPGAKPEAAMYKLNLLSATGTGILAAALLVGICLRFSPRELSSAAWATLLKARWSLLTIACMLALGTVTKYCGADATMGLAMAQTGMFYPFFGTLLGWLGVALTGSDTASNVLFGGLQKITSEQLGIDPVLMCAANSSGGVMGKMVDAQSIVVASTATNAVGLEGGILRYVFFHSIALAVLVGIVVTLQAKVAPFTHMVPGH